jgi:hypothetical protein
MKAIETRYKGYRFRSRLEARWAVVFDALRLPWAYEAEGYDLGSDGYYLPDFFMGHNGHYGPFVEIKGQQPAQNEIAKLTALCDWKTAYGTFLFGPIHEPKWMDFHKDGSFYAKGDVANLEECQVFLGMHRIPDEAKAIAEAVDHASAARFEHGEAGESLSFNLSGFARRQVLDGIKSATTEADMKERVMVAWERGFLGDEEAADWIAMCGLASA